MLIRDLDVQRIIDSPLLPGDEELQLWLEAALIDYSQDAEVLIRIVDSQEITGLNKQYRHKTGSQRMAHHIFGIKKSKANTFDAFEHL
jgi:hypothetical protein